MQVLMLQQKKSRVRAVEQNTLMLSGCGAWIKGNSTEMIQRGHGIHRVSEHLRIEVSKSSCSKLES